VSGDEDPKGLDDKPPTQHVGAPFHINTSKFFSPRVTVIYGPTVEQLEDERRQRGKIKDGDLAVHLAAVRAFNDLAGKVPVEYAPNPVTVDRSILEAFAARLTSNAQWNKDCNDAHSQAVQWRNGRILALARKLREQHPGFGVREIADLILEHPNGKDLAVVRVKGDPHDDQEVTSNEIFAYASTRPMKRETLMDIIKPVFAAK
jgi:hypothetical protein